MIFGGIIIYYYSCASSKPVGVMMRDEYRLRVGENIPNSKYFVVDIETNDIDLLKELNLLFRNFAKRKRKYQ